MTDFNVMLFGGFEVHRSSGPVIEFPTKKARALFALLARHPGRSRSRETLAAMFWPDSAEPEARSNLRQTLKLVRKALANRGDKVIVSDGGALVLEPGTAEVDVDHFERFHEAGTVEALERAAALYRGDFLEGVDLAGGSFAEWSMVEQVRLRERASDVFSRLLANRVDADRTGPAIDMALRLLALDPLQEHVHRHLMKLYLEQGRRGSALEQYRVCRATLERELAIRPEPATEQLYHEIRRCRSRVEPLVPKLPDKPSIAVLPFNNMSGDPAQEYFSDGVTEDIITELSRFHSLFVIARNSSFHYKGQSSKAQDIGRELGVQYIVEGSVRKAGNRVRITAQLVEASSSNHHWAERYDRELDDIFAVQDEVVQAIASAVSGRLEEMEIGRARAKPSENMNAYDYVLRAEWLLRQDYGDPEAVAMLEKAIEIDPQSARAHSRLATLYAYIVFTHRGTIEEFAGKAQSHAEIAILIDDGDPVIHAATAITYSLLGNHDLAGRHIETAIALNPNDAMIMYYAGVVLSYLGNHTTGLQWYKKAMRLDPHFGDALREGMFYANYLARNYDDAIELFRGWRKPAAHMLAHLAAAYAQAGRKDEARAAAADFDRVRPKDLDIVAFAKRHADGFARKDDGKNWLEGYRKAGLLN